MMKRLTILACVSLLVPALAAAQTPSTPDEWYKEGENKYNLGDFQGAVDAFKKGFELETSESKKAAYLFNVAQAYRMAKDCYNAQFFYKRYLSLKENDTKKPLKEDKRKEIEDRIKELDECARQQEAIRNKPPEDDPDKDKNKNGGGDKDKDKGGGDKDKDKDKGKDVADKGGGDVDNDEDGDGIPDDQVHKSTTVDRPRVVSLRAFGGGAKVNTGDLKVPVQATGGLLAGYPLALSDKLVLDLGVGFTFTPVPYETMGTSKSAKLIGLVADVGASFEVAPKFSLRGDLGVGALFFSGVSESPFTNNQETTGALTMFHVRVGLSADYAITPNVLATLIPIAFSYSPAHKGLREDIKSITAIDFMVGLGYRM